MVKNVIHFCIIVSLFLTLVIASSANAESRYPETIVILQTVYADETGAHATYLAYAQRALSENYPNISYLFMSLAASESIHARNFNKLLSELGVEVKEAIKPEIKVSSTKANLKHATQVELNEIDQRYPQFIEKIKAEKHEATIRNLTYAWESEKQHRDLIQKIQSSTGIFFGVLAEKIETTDIKYFVCQVCGSTLTELPKDRCPICKNPASHYKEVERIR